MCLIEAENKQTFHWNSNDAEFKTIPGSPLFKALRLCYYLT